MKLFPKRERIRTEPCDSDAWVCPCGNRPTDGGFYPCDTDGHEIEPTLESSWKGLYVCADCGRIIDQKTLIVTGLNPDPVLLT
jgi:hypothetical protein